MAGFGGMPADEVHGDEPRLIYVLKQVERAGRGALDRAVRRQGITAAQYTALSVLARHPGMSSAQLGRRSFASAQSANEIVTALVSRRLIARQVDPSNRRVLSIYLTPTGRAVLEACDAEVELMEDKMLSLLSPAERHSARLLLERCLQGLIEDLAGPRKRPRRRSSTAEQP